jgi:hypothetical protein
VGSTRLESRELEFILDFAFTTDAEYDDYINGLLLVLSNIKLLQDITNSKETQVTLEKLKVSPEDGAVKRTGTISISFIMLDSFWRDSVATEISATLPAGVNEIALSNTGFMEAYPYMELLFDSSAPQIDIYIDETKEGLQLIDATLGTSTLERLIIDCENGTLTIAGFDRTQNISDRTGYFPIPVGASTLVIDTPALVLLTLTYKKRYYS